MILNPSKLSITDVKYESILSSGRQSKYSLFPENILEKDWVSLAILAK